jgi:hypothetical protein
VGSISRLGGLRRPQIRFQDGIGYIHTELESTGMASARAAQFIRDVITVYCPDQKLQLNSY